jgi:hypothetical protein
MSDNTKNIVMDQGSTLVYVFTLLDKFNNAFNITGFDARLQVRRSYGDTGILINCTLANSKLSISGNAVTLTLLPADTSSIRFNAPNDDTLDCVYDLEIIGLTGKVYKPARGSFSINREVTR